MLPRLVSRFPATEGGCMTPRNLMLSATSNPAAASTSQATKSGLPKGQLTGRFFIGTKNREGD